MRSTRRAFLASAAAAACCRAQDLVPLPSTPAETLTGQKLIFPDALRGQPAVCIFGFDRDADRKLRVWLDPLLRDGVNVWTVAHLGGLPLIHDIEQIDLRRGTSVRQQARMLVMTQDEKTWKKLLQVQDEDRPVAVVLDSQGNARWMQPGSFSKMLYKKVRTQLAQAK